MNSDIQQDKWACKQRVEVVRDVNGGKGLKSVSQAHFNH